MRVQDLQLLYHYHDWATERIIAAAANVSHEQFTTPTAYSHGSLRNILVHLLSAEWVWRVRCQAGRSPSALLPVEDFPTLAAWQQRWREEQAARWTYLQTLTDEQLGGVVNYTRVGGQPQQNMLWHLLVHVVNHGTEHRSEAAAVLTAYGFSPGDIDFVHFLRAKGEG